jgi:hypothetical protein
MATNVMVAAEEMAINVTETTKVARAGTTGITAKAAIGKTPERRTTPTH